MNKAAPSVPSISSSSSSSSSDYLSPLPAKRRAIAPGDVGLVFQHPEAQLFASTVFDDVAFGPRNLKMAKTHAQAEDLVREACAWVGLDFDRFAGRSPFTLSGGEARRTAIAGVLAMRPRFLLLDEPTAGLDAAGYRFVGRLVAQLLGEGVGIVIASHDVGFFSPLADACMVLDEGTATWR
jgi:energy-coupling factor transport system ATP-binding protein